jgi:hypothetical protein
MDQQRIPSILKNKLMYSQNLNHVPKSVSRSKKLWGLNLMMKARFLMEDTPKKVNALQEPVNEMELQSTRGD